MKIGILGTGNVGSTLGRRFAEQGHEIIYGSREPEGEKARRLLSDHPGQASAVAIEEAAASVEVLLLAVPFSAVEDLLGAIGSDYTGILIDATNPIRPELSGLVLSGSDSAGEYVARLADEARVVKAFHTVGFQVMANPDFRGQKALLTVCGDDEEAKALTMDLANSIGFEAVDFGPLRNARYAEPLAMCWIYLAHEQKMGTDIALVLARR